MTICILDAWNPADSALVNSHWVAERTIEMVQVRIGAEIDIVAGEALTRAAAQTKLAGPSVGFAYFGHGRSHMLCGLDADNKPIVIVGVEELRLLGERWFHAFACLSGETLCHDAAREGAAAYLGYRLTVSVEWEVPALPEELQALLVDLVTIATFQLAVGERSQGTIRSLVREASERLFEWIDTHELEMESIPWREHVGLMLLARVLHQELVLEGTAVTP